MRTATGRGDTIDADSDGVDPDNVSGFSGAKIR